MTGGYLKGNLVRKKINNLMDIKLYDEKIIDNYKAQVACMFDLEIIDQGQAMVMLNHYDRLKQEYLNSLKGVICDESKGTD